MSWPPAARNRLVLVGQEHVALALQERVECIARRLVLHRHVVEQLVEVVRGSASDLPCSSCAPYAAITFQRAPPDANGFGSIT
jgi:hypothetical protein